MAGFSQPCEVTSPKDGQLFFGEVKSFNQMKGFGFLSSPASDNMFGKDRG